MVITKIMEGETVFWGRAAGMCVCVCVSRTGVEERECGEERTGLDWGGDKGQGASGGARQDDANQQEPGRRERERG